MTENIVSEKRPAEEFLGLRNSNTTPAVKQPFTFFTLKCINRNIDTFQSHKKPL